MNLLVFENKQDLYSLPAADHRYRHVRQVLRAVAGDTLRIGVIAGPVTVARVTSISADELELLPDWAAAEEMTESPAVTVIVGHPRPPVLGRLWRDLTAMAVAQIRVFAADLGEKSYQESHIWQTRHEYILQGLSQGGHTIPPGISHYPSLERALIDLPSGVGFYGSLDSAPARPVHRMNELHRPDEPLWVVIGPERGFTPREETVLLQSGAHPLSLGHGTLRTETATILLAGVAVSIFGDRSGQRVVPSL